MVTERKRGDSTTASNYPFSDTLQTTRSREVHFCSKKKVPGYTGAIRNHHPASEIGNYEFNRQRLLPGADSRRR